MSKLKVQAPIQHIPTFTEYSIDGGSLATKILALGYKLPVWMLDSYYYYTDLIGWGEILWHLSFKSDLARVDKFDCDNYAFKAMNMCSELYGLNTLGVIIGDIPQGRHAFNILFHGDGFKFFEPNAGFQIGGLFEIGDYGYKGDWVIV